MANTIFHGTKTTHSAFHLKFPRYLCSNFSVGIKIVILTEIGVLRILRKNHIYRISDNCKKNFFKC